MSTNLVGKDQLLADANFQEDHIHQAQSILTEQLNSSQDLQSGGLVGTAGMANMRTAEEIHHAAQKLNATWGSLVDELRRQVGNYDTHDNHTAQAIAGVASGGGELRFT